MDVTRLEAAYAGFLEAAASGPFREPEGSWPAELVVAHVSANDRLIAAHISEVLAGEEPAYDNRPATREDLLRSIVLRAGGFEGLLRESRHTSGRVLSLASQVGSELLAARFRVYILDGETVQVDEAVPIPALVAVQVRVHLPAHTEELLRLRASVRAGVSA
jgi:hypothetical protein